MEIMNIVKEHIDFNREGTPLDKIRVGRSYSPKTFNLKGLRSSRFTRSKSGAYDIIDPYDIKKFLQNIQAGFYPSNFYLESEDSVDLICADELLEMGYTGILFKEKYYRLG